MPGKQDGPLSRIIFLSVLILKKSPKVKVLVDYLFTTITQVISFVKHLQKQFDIQSLLILHFNLDRETCLKNDLGRRELSSEHSIKKMKYDTNVIADDFNSLNIPVVISEEQVVEKQGWHRFVKENVKDVVVDGKYLTSDYWTTGGSRSDLDGNSYPIDGDDPLEFEELDNLIEKICPNITFMQYKHMMRDLKSANIVTIEDGSEGDYYGTWSTAWWSCDLEKFYNYLNEHNMIGEKL